MRITVIAAILIVLFLSTPSYGATPDRFRAIRLIEDLRHDSGQLGAYHALVIGIDDYKDGGIPDLSTAVNDATSLADILASRYGFKVKTLINDQATWDAIDSSLRDLASLDPSDSVLIYFAGHGELDRTFSGGWWIPYDAVLGKTRTYMDNALVQRAMANIRARHVLLISDSCYSGTLFGEVTRAMPPRITDNKYYLALYNEKSRWGMTSGNKEPVSDKGSGGHSVFAYHLLKTLRENPQPFLSTQEIYTRIAPVVSNNSDQTPMCRPVKNTGDQGGEFVFVTVNVQPAPAVQPPQLPATADKEALFWESIKDSNNSAAFEAYLKQFPNGTFKLLAEIRRDALKAEAASSPQGVPAPAPAEAPTPKPVFQAQAPAKPSAGSTWREPITGMEFVYIPGGCYQMGSPLGEGGRYPNERPVHEVCVDSFWIVKYEVTNDQYRKFRPGHDSRDYKGNSLNGGSQPAVYVSWEDAKAYAEWLTRQSGGRYKFRLPTEAEWEYACRAGTRTARYWGDDPDQACGYSNVNDITSKRINNFSREQHNCDDGYEVSAPVGTYRPNAFGLFDMLGNVWEWVEDWYNESAYNSYDRNNPVNVTGGSRRVGRGGSWYGSPRDVRCALRDGGVPGLQRDFLGFRLARTP